MSRLISADGKTGRAKMQKPVDYIIISKPDYVKFTCPHCNEDVEVSFDEVDFKTDYWGDGAFVDCPECGKEVELDRYEYS